MLLAIDHNQVNSPYYHVGTTVDDTWFNGTAVFSVRQQLGFGVVFCAHPDCHYDPRGKFHVSTTI